ncbi:MAG: BMC domain-containing protein [Acidobacteria bacterium]|nr:BMC domain-containing protein [Candidatus Sulfomarinibacter sp. MAG AM2]
MQPAIALIEFDSIAIGIRAGDAMVKRAPVDVTYAGTVHPGKYLVLVGGDVACVEESFAAGLAAGGDVVLDRIFLPSAHPEVVRYLRGMRGRVTGEALGIVETRTVAATLGAADRGLKGAEVDLVELKLADRLGGKAYCVFSGTVADVEAAVEIAVDHLEDPSTLVAQVVIPDFHDEMLANLEAATEFSARISGGRG